MLITPESTSVLECTEASQTFSDKPLEGSKHYADLYTLALDICKEDVHQQMAKAKAVFVNSVYEFLTTCKVLSYAWMASFCLNKVSTESLRQVLINLFLLFGNAIFMGRQASLSWLGKKLCILQNKLNPNFKGVKTKVEVLCWKRIQNTIRTLFSQKDLGISN